VANTKTVHHLSRTLYGVGGHVWQTQLVSIVYPGPLKLVDIFVPHYCNAIVGSSGDCSKKHRRTYSGQNVAARHLGFATISSCKHAALNSQPKLCEDLAHQNGRLPAGLFVFTQSETLESLRTALHAASRRGQVAKAAAAPAVSSKKPFGSNKK